MLEYVCLDWGDIMKFFRIRELWDLRGQLDKAILNGEYDKIKEIKENYEKLVQYAWNFNCGFICFNHAFGNEGERRDHNVTNINSILNNIENYERKFVNGEDVSLKLKTQSTTPFLAGEIWVLRAMYDKFLLDSEKENDASIMQQNMILGKAINDRLLTLSRMEQTQYFYEEFTPIIKEVREGFVKAYGDNQPKISYHQLTEDYLEH